MKGKVKERHHPIHELLFYAHYIQRKKISEGIQEGGNDTDFPYPEES